MPRLFSLLVLLAVALPMAACTSARGQFERGQELEAEGDYAEAVRRYADAIRRDDDGELATVRGRLREAGRLAIQERLDRIQAARLRGDALDEADTYAEIDALLAETASVGETLDTPPSFRADRRAAYDEALAVVQTVADEQARGGQYEDAIGTLEDARARYDPGPEQDAALYDRAASLHVRWAEAAADRGQWREAYRRAGLGLDYTAGRGPASGPLARLRDEALERGRVTLAVLPGGVERTPQTEGAPRGFTRALTEALEAAAYDADEPFVLTLDPREVRRAVGRSASGTRLLGSPLAAGRVVRRTGADLGLISGVEAFALDTTRASSRERPARTRSGRSVTYTEVEETVRARASVAYEVVTENGRRVCGSSLERTASDRIRRAEYAGNAADLDLDRNERALFAGRDDRLADLTVELTDALAQAVLERALACALQEVP